MRRLSTVLALSILLGGVSRLCAQSRPAPVVPRLLVFITVDQLRPDYLDLFASQLTGGLARLSKKGAFFTNAALDYAITETAPGHASTMSGRFPRSTGIVANSAGALDLESPLIAGAPDSGASPYRFRGTTLADWMRYAHPETRVLSVSRKDRAAILPIGRAKGQAFWYATNGTYTTSTYYHDTLPSWVQRFNTRRIPQSYAGKTWDLLLPPSAYPEADSVELESSEFDYLFPHPFPPTGEQVAKIFAAYPMMDEMTLQFALAGLNALELGANPERTDLLAVSLSTTDAVGHRFGPDSREIHDQILRLDRYLGVFIDSLYRLRDSSTIMFALTADHGVSPIPELEKSRFRSGPAGRADLLPVVRSLYRGMAAAKVDTSAYAWREGFLVLEPEGLARAKLNRDSVARWFAGAMSKVNGVARADLWSDLAKKDTTQDVIARRWLHSLPPEMPVAVTVTLKPFWYRGDAAIIATHGSPYDSDARIPVIFYGPWIKPGRYDDISSSADMAPTLAAILGIRPMERLDGRVLRSAVR